MITVTGGDYRHHVLLIADGNGDFRCWDGDDYVIDITNYTGTITTANFI